MAKKRHKTDRNRTAEELAERLSQIKPIDPFAEEGLFEIQPPANKSALFSVDLVALDFLRKVVKKGYAYKAVDLYYILKYTTGIDRRFLELGASKWSYRAGPDTIGARPVFMRLWQNGKIRKFAKDRFSPSAGGRYYGVVYLISW